MKKLLCVVPALLVFAMIGAPNARADSYTPTFTCSPSPQNSDFGCNYITSTYTAPDVTFPSPTLQAAIAGNVYDVTLPAADAPTDSYTYRFGEFSTGPVPLQDTGQLTIDDVTTGTTDTVMDNIGDGVQEFPIQGDGAITFTPVSTATPEPAAILLVLLGAGLIFFMRKRFVMSIPRTA